LTVFLGESAIIKERLNKKYRHPILDNKLSSERIALVLLNFITFSLKKKKKNKKKKKKKNLK